MFWLITLFLNIWFKSDIVNLIKKLINFVYSLMMIHFDMYCRCSIDSFLESCKSVFIYHVIRVCFTISNYCPSLTLVQFTWLLIVFKELINLKSSLAFVIFAKIKINVDRGLMNPKCFSRGCMFELAHLKNFVFKKQDKQNLCL